MELLRMLIKSVPYLLGSVLKYRLFTGEVARKQYPNWI